jgi:ATP-dependent Clp protease ATP-binding subunit ClpB
MADTGRRKDVSRLAVVDIALERVQPRIVSAAAGKPFLIKETESAREFLVAEGNDVRYGARQLKRAIERLLVSLSNLIATDQISISMHRRDTATDRYA